MKTHILGHNALNCALYLKFNGFMLIKCYNSHISIDLPSVDDNLDDKVYLFRQEISMHDAGYIS
jgi:hypothetical protein